MKLSSHLFSFTPYLLPLAFLLCLSGCDEALIDEENDLFDEGEELLHPATPPMEVKSVNFSPDNKRFTVTTSLLRDIGPYSFTDSSSVRVVVRETVNGIPQVGMLPKLTAIRNTSAAHVDSLGLKMLVLVDLTLPQELVDRQNRAIGEMLTSFQPKNLYISFMYGDSITMPIEPSDFVMSHYFRHQPIDYKYLYRSIWQSLQAMAAHQHPWDDSQRLLMVVFSDEKVYLDDNHPMDPRHFKLQENLLQTPSDSVTLIPTYYISLNTNKDTEDDHAAGILKMFCQNHEGQFLNDFNWVAIKDSVFHKYHIGNSSDEFDFVNPDFKIYRGNLHILTLDFYSVRGDSLIASVSTQIHKGSIYEPVIVRGHKIWLVLMQGIFLGLLLLAAVYLVFQFIIPFLGYQLFCGKNVVTYTGPLMSLRNKIIGQSCYLCKAPFEVGDKVVVKCDHTMHKSCWDENDGHCPEYPDRCTTGSYYYNRHCLHDLKNTTFYMTWVLVGMATAICAWLLFTLWSHYSTVHILEWILQLFGMIPDDATDINEFAQHDKRLPAFGLSIGVLLTFSLSSLALYHRNVKHKWASVIIRSLIAGLCCMICFLFIGFMEQIFEIDNLSFVLEWIPWTLSAFFIAFAVSYKTRIQLRGRMLLVTVFLSLFSMAIWSFFFMGAHLDFRVLLLFSYLIFSVGIALCVAQASPKSERYFLRIEGPVKTMEIALYKWFRNEPHHSVTIGKSVNCDLQMSWDINSAIPPVQAEITIDDNTVFLHAVEDGISTSEGVMQAGDTVPLYQDSQFLIGQTTFTYVEKD